jgi:hypothetical protein
MCLEGLQALGIVKLTNHSHPTANILIQTQDASCSLEENLKPEFLTPFQMERLFEKYWNFIMYCAFYVMQGCI